MTCTEAVRVLLEVAPEEVAGLADRDTELSRHLRECPRCRAAADRILEGQAVLHHYFTASAPPPSGADAARRALLTAQRRGLRRRRLWQAGGPLAAAAVLAGILVIRHAGGPGIPLPAAPPTTGHRGVTVTAPPGRNVAVLNSDSSDVVVIWFF